MTPEFTSIRLADLDSVGAYELLSATVVPRPIAFVSTVDGQGNPNLAPFSFFTVGGSSPPSLLFSPTLNADGEAKDTLRNVFETGEFVVNTVHRDMAEGMIVASLEFATNLSEWKVSGYTAIPSVLVRPPRVLESLVQFECKLFDVVAHGSGPHAARYVVGEVLIAHLESSIASDPARIRTISRLGGRAYADLDRMELFQLDPPV